MWGWKKPEADLWDWRATDAKLSRTLTTVYPCRCDVSIKLTPKLTKQQLRPPPVPGREHYPMACDWLQIVVAAMIQHSKTLLPSRCMVQCDPALPARLREMRWNVKRFQRGRGANREWLTADACPGCGPGRRRLSVVCTGVRATCFEQNEILRYARVT